jgi:hypothetical protein
MEVSMTFSKRDVSVAVILFCVALLLSPLSAESATEQQVQYFPQLADGGGYTTTWYFTGYSAGPSTIDVSIFDNNGKVLPLATDQGTSYLFHLSLNGYGSFALQTLGVGSSVRTGWVKVTSTPPVGVTESYKYIGPNGLVNQAAVLPSGPIGVAAIFVSDTRNTAVAILNVSSTNTLSFRLLDRNGNQVAVNPAYPMPPYTSSALYVNQIPGFQNVTTLEGSMEVSGSSTVFLTALAFDGPSFATTPILAGRSEPASSRGDILNQFNSLLVQTKDMGDQLLPPSAEDLATYASFLSQPQTGLVRLLPRETYDGLLTIRGGGAYYSFAHLTHEYGYGSDIGLEPGHLQVGFAGYDFGLMTNLGDVPIDGVTLDTPAAQNLATFKPPTVPADIRTEQQLAGSGVTMGGYTYGEYLAATASSTYLLRSICYGESDVLVVFRLVRIDKDGSVLLLWKMLQTFAPPIVT